MRKLIVTVGVAVSLFAACEMATGPDTGPDAGGVIGSAYLPAVLTGGAGYDSEPSAQLARPIGRQSAAEPEPAYVFDFPLEQWALDYPNWQIVPKVATYFNNLFVQTLENLDQGPMGAVEIDHAVYTVEGTFDGDDIVRVDDAGANWERLFHMGESGYQSYARYQEQEGTRRAMRIMFDIGGSGNNEMLELYETESHKFVKVLWWSNVSPDAGSPPRLDQFVSVVDKRTSDHKTTARYYAEILEAGDFTTHVVSFAPGTQADVDYFTYDQLGGQGLEYYDTYGYFNNVEYELELAGAAASSGDFSAYPDPDLVTGLLDDGFTEADWTTIRDQLTGGTDGIDFPDWDISAFE